MTLKTYLIINENIEKESSIDLEDIECDIYDINEDIDISKYINK